MATDTKPVTDAFAKGAQGLTEAGTALKNAIGSIDSAVAALDTRVKALEAGGGTNPVPPDPPTPTTGWPDATNSGCSGTLTAYTGSMSIGSNVKIENKTFPSGSTLRCQGSNIIIRNCKLETGNVWGIDADGSTGIVIENVTISGRKAGQNSCILSGTAGKIRKCDLSGFDNGITLQDGACEVSDCYIHNLGGTADAHVDGISVQGGQSGTLIKHNHVESYDTSCVFIKCDFGPISNTTVDGNRLINAPGKSCSYTTYSIRGNSGQTPTGTKYLNNVIQKGTWGYWSTEGSVTRTGNKDYVTGQSIDSVPGLMAEEAEPTQEMLAHDAKRERKTEALGKELEDKKRERAKSPAE